MHCFCAEEKLKLSTFVVPSGERLVRSMCIQMISSLNIWLQVASPYLQNEPPWICAMAKYEDENKKSCFRPKKAELVLNKYKAI